MEDPYGVQKLMFENFTRLGAPINGKTQAHHLHFAERLEAIDTMQSELGAGFFYLCSLFVYFIQFIFFLPLHFFNYFCFCNIFFKIFKF